MRRRPARRRIGVALGGVVVLLTACSPNSPNSTSSPPASAGAPHSKVAGGTAYWAEPVGSEPNYIFPFMSLTYESAANVDQLQDLMYRPLYWFGQGDSPVVNESLSLAQAPVYSNNDETVTINLNSYQWSDKESLDSTDVMFWMNMMHADKDNWADYAPGAFPDNVKSVTVAGPDQLIFQLTQSVNPAWFSGNELSQITPLPTAWDITHTGAAPGSGGCSGAAYGTADGACNAVYSFLSAQSGPSSPNVGAANSVMSSYATSPLWQVVDGPWELSSIDDSGHVAFKPNPSYSGPVKPTLSSFVEVPFASSDSEYASLVDTKVDVGYLPVQDAPAAAPGAAPQSNNSQLSEYRLSPLYGWSINFIPYNFNSIGDNGAAGRIFSQLYFRQAFQLLIDQEGTIKNDLSGYGIPDYGPVPDKPANPFVSSSEATNPYPYDTTRAVQLLKENGWNVVPGGTSTCVDPGSGPGQCGAGIGSGAALDFNLEYAQDTPWTGALLTAEKASWAGAGITVDLTSSSSDAVSAGATPCAGGASCTWELADWGTGWTFSPDHYPSGEELFGSGSALNSGSYSDFIADEEIAQSEHTTTDLSQYENYLAKELPVVFEPTPATSLTEILGTLGGVTPQNVLGALTPEDWYFVQ